MKELKRYWHSNFSGHISSETESDKSASASRMEPPRSIKQGSYKTIEHKGRSNNQELSIEIMP
jgi:hypothetical protein